MEQKKCHPLPLLAIQHAVSWQVVCVVCPHYDPCRLSFSCIHMQKKKRRLPTGYVRSPLSPVGNEPTGLAEAAFARPLLPFG
jgi:hypothetical protein